MGYLQDEATTSTHDLSATDAGGNVADSLDAPLLGPHGASSGELSSPPKTVANIFLAVVGAGVLGLPYTFLRTGYLAGTLLLLLVAALSFHGMLLLLLSRRRLLLSLHPKPPPASFGDLALAASGPLGRLAVDFMILLSQAGFCASYLIFVASTLRHLLPGLPTVAFHLLQLPFQLALSAVPSLTRLAPLSILAGVVDLAAMAVVMLQEASLALSPARPPAFAFAGLAPLFYGAGVAVYAFEGVGMVIPLESEARDKRRFPAILAVAVLLIALLYAAFGILGYLAFGPATSDIITANLGPGLLTAVVQLGLCLNLFFSFPLMMNPVHELVERRLAAGTFTLPLRFATVIVVALVAISVPNFADFLSLVGSSVCCLLGFVLPAFFHLRVFRGDISFWWVAGDVAMIVIGLVLAVTGTYSSLSEIFSGKA